MASIVNYVADGATNQFQIPFTYINQTDVVVTVNGTTPTFTFLNTTTINIASTPTSGAKVIIKRVTPLNALVDFTDGSTLFEADLDLAHQQNRLIAEESRDRADSAINTIDANITNINTVAGIAANVTTVAGNTTNVNSVATNMAEVLLADTNAATATTKASQASASASTASAQATISTTKAGQSSTSASEALASKNAASSSQSASATSETNAANSATASANSASASSSSASSSSSSQTVATTKANEAVVSANNSATSATSSANSATLATTKASQAGTSQSASAVSETNALSSKNAAATSATNAETSKNNAATSATASANSSSTSTTKANEAASSATAAANSATASANSATAGANSATAAANSASSITGAETNAANSASAASASKDAALAALDSFDDRYLGTKSSNPSVDNDGNALVAGALYFNTSDNTMKVYEGSNWVAAYASVSDALLKTGGVMTGAITTNSTFDGRDVAADGILATNALPKAGGAMTGAITTNSTFDGRDVAADGVLATNALPKSGGTMTGNIAHGSDFTLDVAGNITLDAGGGDIFLKQNGTHYGSIKRNNGDLQIHSEASDENILFVGKDGSSVITALTLDMANKGSAIFNTDASITAQGTHNEGGGQLFLKGTDTPAASKNLGQVNFGNSDDQSLAMIRGESTAATGADLVFQTEEAGAAIEERMRINDSGEVGIGTNDAKRKLHVSSGGTISSGNQYDVAIFQNSDAAGIRLVDAGNGGSNGGNAGLGNDNGNLNVASAGVMSFSTNLTANAPLYNGSSSSTGGTERMRIDTSGNVLVGTTSTSSKLEVNGDIGIGRVAGGYTFREVVGGGERAGINSDANNHLIFNTSNASEAMRINDSGNLGIGTTSPSAPIDVVTNSNVYSAEFIQSNTSNGDGVLVQVGSNSASDYALTVRSNAGNHSGLAVKADGNVGIGTFTPKRHIHLNGGNETTKIQITNQTTGSSSDGDGFQLGIATDGTANIEQRENADLVFATNNTERMRIDTSGNLGIGTSSPETMLHIQNSSGNASAQLTSGTSGTSYINMGDTGNVDAGQISYINNGDAMAFTAGSSERMRIKSSGNVGIGTNNPQRPLHVNGTEGVARFTSTNSGNNGFEVGIGTSSQAFLWQAENSHMAFATNNTERMRINSSGRQVYNGSGTANGHANFVGEVGTSSKALSFEHTVGGGEIGSIRTTSSTAVYYGDGSNLTGVGGSTTRGDVGTYTIGCTTSFQANVTIARGATIAGNTIAQGNTHSFRLIPNREYHNQQITTQGLSGTWRNMGGDVRHSNVNDKPGTLWCRIS